MRPPAWRWLRAAYLLARRQKPLRRLDDQHLTHITRFQELLGACRAEQDLFALRALMPALFEAYNIYCHAAPAIRYELQARILAAEPHARIGRKLALTEDAVIEYERTFFNVQDRLQAPSWIMHQVIGRPKDTAASEDPIGRLWMEPGAAIWAEAGELAQMAEDAWIRPIAGEDEVFADGLRRKLAALRAELAGGELSPLERLLVDRVAVC
jgi:hypothetical protein